MLLLALSLAVADPSAAAAGEAPQMQQKPVSAAALALSRLLNPEPDMRAMMERAFDAGFAAGKDADPQAGAAYAEHPGLEETIRKAGQKAMAANVDRIIAKALARFARFYDERLTQNEIQDMIAFYGSPTGRKVVAGMYAGIDMNQLVERLGPDGQSDISGSDVGAINRRAVTRILPSITAADRTALMKFAATPTFARLRSILPDFQRLVASIANEPDPVLNAAIETEVSKAVNAFLAAEEGANKT